MRDVKDSFEFQHKLENNNEYEVIGSDLVEINQNDRMAYFFANFEDAQQIECTYNYEYLCQLHSTLFANMIEQAGTLRNYDSPDCPTKAKDIYKELKDAFNQLKNLEQDRMPDEIKTLGFSRFLVKLSEIRPFPEGNMEVGILVCKKFLMQNGYENNSNKFFDNTKAYNFRNRFQQIKEAVRLARDKGNYKILQEIIRPSFDKSKEAENKKRGLGLFRRSKTMIQTNQMKLDRDAYSNMVEYRQEQHQNNLDIFQLSDIHYKLHKGEGDAGKFRDSNKVSERKGDAKRLKYDFRDVSVITNRLLEYMRNLNWKSMDKNKKIEVCVQFMAELYKVRPFAKGNEIAIVTFMSEFDKENHLGLNIERLIDSKNLLKFLESKENVELMLRLAAAEGKEQNAELLRNYVHMIAYVNGNEVEIEIMKKPVVMTWEGYVKQLKIEKNGNKETGANRLKNMEDKDR